MVKTSTYTIKVPVDHIFTVTLEANPSTGYQWTLSNPLDAHYLAFYSKEYVPPQAPSRIGQSGRQVYSFQALRQGMTSISLKYCRPWEGGECGEFVFYVVDVV